MIFGFLASGDFDLRPLKVKIGTPVIFVFWNVYIKLGFSATTCLVFELEVRKDGEKTINTAGYRLMTTACFLITPSKYIDFYKLIFLLY